MRLASRLRCDSILVKSEGGDRVLKKEKKILETFGKVIPRLSEIEKEKLLMFGEGIAFKVEQQGQAEPKPHGKGHSPVTGQVEKER